MSIQQALIRWLIGVLRSLGCEMEKFEPGHFYSAIPSLKEIRKREAQIWRLPPPEELHGIKLRKNEQFELLVNELYPYYKDRPAWRKSRSGQYRYFDSGWYFLSDAIFLYSMLRHLKPRKVIEVGSGFSSAAILDVNEQYLGNRLGLTCIDPNPHRLLSLLRETDHTRVEISRDSVQDVTPSLFSQLQERDILLIDSTHVLKTGSDVNYLLFEILPTLNAGVYIHFHDVFYPFEYPKEFLYLRRAWNEDYGLRAFLQFNHAFEIALFNDYVQIFFKEWFEEHMPVCLAGRSSSIWLRKVIPPETTLDTK